VKESSTNWKKSRPENTFMFYFLLSNSATKNLRNRSQNKTGPIRPLCCPIQPWMSKTASARFCRCSNKKEYRSDRELVNLINLRWWLEREISRKGLIFLRTSFSLAYHISFRSQWACSSNNHTFSHGWLLLESLKLETLYVPRFARLFSCFAILV